MSYEERYKDPPSNFGLVSRAANDLGNALKEAVSELGYDMSRQVVHIINNDTRWIRLSFWPSRDKTSLAHHSLLDNIIEREAPGGEYNGFLVEVAMAEPEIFERRGYNINPPE